jgi:hypothetical protein
MSFTGAYPVQMYYVNSGSQLVGLFTDTTGGNPTLKKFNASDLTTVIATYTLPSAFLEMMALDGDDLFFGSHTYACARFNWRTWTLVANFYPYLGYIQRPATIPGYIHIIYGGSYYTGYSYYNKSNNSLTMISGTQYATTEPIAGPSNFWGTVYYYSTAVLYKFSMANPPVLLATTTAPWGQVFNFGTYDTVHNLLWIAGTQSSQNMYKIDPATNAITGTYAIPAQGNPLTFVAATSTIEWVQFPSAGTAPHLYSFDTNTYVTTDKGVMTTDLVSPSQPPNRNQEPLYPRLIGSTAYPTATQVSALYKYQ